jgi:hypothetical protein
MYSTPVTRLSILRRPRSPRPTRVTIVCRSRLPVRPLWTMLCPSSSMMTGICIGWLGSRVPITSPRLSRTLFTVPTGIPLNFTGAPTLSPFTSPLKNRTAGYRWRKKRPEPRTPTATTPRTTAPTTKAPMVVALARFMCCSR